MSTGLILLAVLALVGLWAAGIYNRLVTLRNQVKNGWSQIDVQLQRRLRFDPQFS